MVVKSIKGLKYASGTSCPINVVFAKLMTRSLQFVKEYNGLRGSRLILVDFFTPREVEVYRNGFLRDNRTRTIAAVGYSGHGVYGIGDEIYDGLNASRFR